MPLIIENSSPESIDESLELGVKEVNNLLDDNMEFLVNEYVIPECRAVAMSSNVPDDFVIGIKFVKTGYLEGEIINTWGTKELPLALWFNYGTRDHGSKGDYPLHWKDKETGDDIYAMWVRGVPKTLVMETGIEIGTERLKAAVPKFIEEKIA